MSVSAIQLLPIEEHLKNELLSRLERFESFRVGRNLTKEVVKEEKAEVKNKKSKLGGLLQRLFLTEYD